MYIEYTDVLYSNINMTRGETGKTGLKIPNMIDRSTPC